MRVLIVGAGVVGLSCGVRLREAGADAHVVAEHTGAATTSAAAAALWYPYRVDPPERVVGWAARTREVLLRLAGDPATGVRLRDGVERLRTAPDGPPWWAAAVPGLCWLDRVPGYAGGWAFRAPVADTGWYLGWLGDRFAALGGTVRRARIGSVAEARADADAVVLATGIGASTLPGDPAVTPVRGQVVRVRAPSVREYKVEFYNRFSSWCRFGNHGVIADNDPEEQEKIVKFSTLLTNTVIFHTTLDMMMVIRELIAEGWTVTPEDLAVLSPYLTARIQRFGVYATDEVTPTPGAYDAHLGVDLADTA